MEKEKQKWGGRREGAGRPKKDPTKTISTRVKVKHFNQLKVVIKGAVNEWRNENDR
jgi:hypothetical protein